MTLACCLGVMVGCVKNEAHINFKGSGNIILFVATNGNDSWSGRLPSPNRAKSDGPLASLSNALQVLRLARSDSNRSATISIRGGNYFLNQTLVLKPEDSNIEIVAVGNEKPVLSAGHRISGWKPVTVKGKSLWAATAGERGGHNRLFRELWVNGKRAVRARHPNRGYLSVAELPDKVSAWTEGHKRFRFRAGDVNAWDAITNAEIIVMTRWVESRLPIVSVEADQVVTFGKRSVFELAAGDAYYAEHAFELLDQPGEWYFDAAEALVYYWPLPGERVENCEAVAPNLVQVLRLEGNLESGKFIEGVVFRGLTFSHSEWYFPEGFDTARDKPQVSPEPKSEVGGFAQAAIGVPGAVWGQGVRRCRFERCAFVNLGNYGLELGRGCQSNLISRCEFAELGAGGIRIGETAIRTQPNEHSYGNEISDCRIHDGGKLFHSAIGVWIGQSYNNEVAHNLIHDFYYTGISIGWTWGYGPALATNNLVHHNHVHHIGVQSEGDGPILSDMAGIYTLGRQPGTTIVNNLWHDVAATRYGGWGIYFDEGSSGIRAASNVVYRTTHGGFHQHYGQTNVVRNNIFALARDHQLQRTRVEPHISFSFETNIVYFDSGVLLAGDWSGDNFIMDSNLYFDSRQEARKDPDAWKFGGQALQEWRRRGKDLRSLVADPLFGDVNQDDFRLQPGSPAGRVGFQPIDLTGVGPR